MKHLLLIIIMSIILFGCPSDKTYTTKTVTINHNVTDPVTPSPVPEPLSGSLVLLGVGLLGLGRYGRKYWRRK